MRLCGSLSILWHCLSLGLEWKLTISSPVATTVFQICWHIECSTFTASSLRIWNSSTGIPSPPLALFIVMLPKAHLTLNSLPCVPLQISSCKQSPPRTSCLRPVLTTAHQLAEITRKSAVGCDLPSPSSLGALPFLLNPELSSHSVWNQKLFISLQFFHFPPCHSSRPFFLAWKNTNI